MIVYNNQAPTAPNNVGQFGASDGSIGAYKQAAEYAADAKYWSLLAQAKFGTIDDLLVEVERLYQQGILLKEDIEQLKQDFQDQDARLMQLIADANNAANNAQNAVDIINAKIIEVQEQLDILMGMSVEVTTLPPGSQATGDFDNTTGKISLGIPQGLPGKDGSVTDLSTVSTGVPQIDDIGFYVDKDDNTVHKASLSDIANLIPSVRSVSLNGGPALVGDVALDITKDTVGLGSVLNVPSYSKTEVDDKIDGFMKTYKSKVEADADASDRLVGEDVMVWNGASYDFYKVSPTHTLTLQSSEPRVVTVNSRVPDSSGNIDITIPTGNPSLYLGEMLMFPYNPNQPITYQGVLPADGRLISRDSNPDLVSSIIAGSIPVVTEEAWQAGSRHYFSWGPGGQQSGTQLRLPDWTSGDAFRSPNKATDTGYSGAPIDQKPYITTVNGVSPSDSTGAVVLTPEVLGAAKSGANNDITELNGLTKPLTVAQGGTGASDVGNARLALNLQTFHAINGTGVGVFSSMSSPDGSKQLRLANDGGFRLVDQSNSNTIPFGVSSGGTGSETVAGARVNLGVDRFVQLGGSETQIKPTSTSQKRLFCNDNGDWGYYDDSSSETLALRVSRGGTGATTLEAARFNLNVDRLYADAGSTGILSPNKTKTVFVEDSGKWGGYDNSTGQDIPLGVAQGGTGAKVFPDTVKNIGAVGDGYEDLNLAHPNLPSGVYYVGDQTSAGGGGKPFNYAQVLTVSENKGISGNWTQVAFSTLSNSAPRIRRRNNNPALLSNWSDFLVYGLNATTDTNGFYKIASPIVQLNGDGSSKLNDGAEGVTTDKIGVGVYRVSGVLGFNSDPAWGGINGGFSIPQNSNGLPILWVDYEVEQNGDITLRTFHREHANVPNFARNHIDGVVDGDPIDIPAGRWIDLRVEMPES